MRKRVGGRCPCSRTGSPEGNAEGNTPPPRAFSLEPRNAVGVADGPGLLEASLVQAEVSLRKRPGSGRFLRTAIPPVSKLPALDSLVVEIHGRDHRPNVRRSLYARPALSAPQTPTTPANPNWSGLSPCGREALGKIGMRLAAGYNSDEIAAIIQAERGEIEHLPLPARGRPVSRLWVLTQLRELRGELREVSD